MADAVGDWRDGDRCAQFFFVRKPPGLRLRFAGDDLAARLEPHLTHWLTAAERRNSIRGFRYTSYEPECHRFGGEAGMAIAHRLFDGDADTVLRFESEAADLAVEHTERVRLSLRMCQDLFSRCLDDSAEMWDVWKRLEITVRGVTGHVGDTDLAVIECARAAASSATVIPGPVDQLHKRVADELRAVADSGRLTRSPRAWLTAATAFHWNRWGLPMDLVTLADHVRAMTGVLEPDQG